MNTQQVLPADLSLSVLRAGNARMLQAVIAAYPGGLTREEIGTQSGIVHTSGTFSTYLGVLRRTELVEERDGLLVASDILIHGAAAAQSSSG